MIWKILLYIAIGLIVIITTIFIYFCLIISSLSDEKIELLEDRHIGGK